MPLESSELRPTDFLNAKGRYKCSMCVNTYRHFKHLKRHLNSHTHEVVYECDDCGRRFSRGDLLQRHRRKCAMSDDEHPASYRIRRTRARRASSMSSSGDSDVSGSYSHHSDSGYIYNQPETQLDLSAIRRSGRHTMHPETYAEDSFTATQTSDAASQPLTVAGLQQPPRLPSLNFPQRHLEQPDNYANKQLTADWISQLQVPQTPPGLSESFYHPEQTGYDTYYSDLSSTEPGWLASVENEANNMDFSNPVSPAWESVDVMQATTTPYAVDRKPSTDGYSELYLRDPEYDAVLDKDYSSPIMPFDTDFPEYTSEFQWSNPTSSFVY